MIGEGKQLIRFFLKSLGRLANLEDSTHPDWSPNKHLGYEVGVGIHGNMI